MKRAYRREMRKKRQHDTYLSNVNMI